MSRTLPDKTIDNVIAEFGLEPMSEYFARAARVREEALVRLSTQARQEKRLQE